MGSRKRQRSHKTYGPAAFANKRQIRRMKLRDGGCPPTKPGVWFEKNGLPVEVPRRMVKL